MGTANNASTLADAGEMGCTLNSSTGGLHLFVFFGTVLLFFSLTKAKETLLNRIENRNHGFLQKNQTLRPRLEEHGQVG
ncbi:hypothetical protein SAMN05216571_106156 [Onishia taeanensis]|uniref:Uncharacterized protein n=1 Tax=Onishia taeanensis TaxID=284577 RepID=A0A1G7SGJ3_9GAMM|nr:hypothetical protein SAMN05216571_106156 [Halomonas taeanensis]